MVLDMQSVFYSTCHLIFLNPKVDCHASAILLYLVLFWRDTFQFFWGSDGREE